jgi:hypothetical protein
MVALESGRSQEAGVTDLMLISDPLRGAEGGELMELKDESMHFTSICPNCAEGRPQRGYTRRALANSLNNGYEIEAYCVGCDNFWSISAQERRSIVDALGELINAPTTCE